MSVIRKFTLNRNGIFTVNVSSENQCKVKGHTRYKYHVEIDCSGVLDSDGFIIDQLILHNNILKWVKERNISYSCEEYCQYISALISTILNNNKVVYDRIYIKVIPLPFNKSNGAYMELTTTYK